MRQRLLGEHPRGHLARPRLHLDDPPVLVALHVHDGLEPDVRSVLSSEAPAERRSRGDALLGEALEHLLLLGDVVGMREVDQGVLAKELLRFVAEHLAA